MRNFLWAENGEDWRGHLVNSEVCCRSRIIGRLVQGILSLGTCHYWLNGYGIFQMNLILSSISDQKCSGDSGMVGML